VIADKEMREKFHMSITPLRFTGISTYSTDLQTILTRAVAIASLPIQLLQNQQADLIAKKQTLSSINGSLQSLESAVSNLGGLGGTKALSVTSSNTSRVTVTLNGAEQPASYTITDITSVAKPASENTLSGLATADSTAVDSGDDTLELVFGSDTYVLDLSSYGNHLNGVRDAINDLGIGLSATVLDTGEEPNPFYLSVSSITNGETTLKLRTESGNDATNILSANNQGTDTVFKLNGLTIQRSDKVITDVAEGIVFTIQDETEEGESVVLSLSSSRAILANALNSLVSAYNAVSDRLDAQVGENAGLLSGDYIIRQTRTTLQKIVGYHADGNVQSLVDLGIDVDKNGVMSFNSTKFYSLPTNLINSAFTFLGSSSTGFGQLSDSISQISDPISGFIRKQQDSYDSADTKISGTIATLSSRIEQMQLGLSEKLQKADALLSTLQAQQSALEGSLQSVNLATYGKKS